MRPRTQHISYLLAASSTTAFKLLSSSGSSLSRAPSENAKKNLGGSTAINKIHPVSFLIAGLIYSLPKHCVIKQMQKLIKPTHLTRRSDCVQRTIRLEIGFDVEFRDPADCDQYEVVDEIGSNRSIERRNLETVRLVDTSSYSIDTIFTPQESVIDQVSSFLISISSTRKLNDEFHFS